MCPQSGHTQSPTLQWDVPLGSINPDVRLRGSGPYVEVGSTHAHCHGQKSRMPTADHDQSGTHDVYDDLRETLSSPLEVVSAAVGLLAV